MTDRQEEPEEREFREQEEQARLQKEMRSRPRNTDGFRGVG